MHPTARSAASMIVLWVACAIPLSARFAAAQEKILYSFGNTAGDGRFPLAGLVFDSSGNLYGTDYDGGADGLGTVFELSPAKVGGWFERTLYSFNRTRTLPGLNPRASLIVDGTGDLYGTTSGAQGGYGTAFELKHWPSGGWTFKVLHEFGDDGKPQANLVFDTEGNLYGTTLLGSAFELIPTTSGSWTYSVLHNFLGHGDGQSPTAGMIFDGVGNLYGTTSMGGAHSYGSVFELSPTGDGGWSVNLLHSFEKNNDDGITPWAGLILDGSGNLYGTTAGGGANGAAGTKPGGTVFEMSLQGDGTWAETLLHSFGSGTDGSEPVGSLIFDPAGNLYGITGSGGVYGLGTLFRLTPAAGGGWTETVLHNFGNGKDGSNPIGTLILDSTGDLYGTTSAGGLYGGGTVFKFTP